MTQPSITVQIVSNTPVEEALERRRPGHHYILVEVPEEIPGTDDEPGDFMIAAYTDVADPDDAVAAIGMTSGLLLDATTGGRTMWMRA